MKYASSPLLLLLLISCSAVSARADQTLTSRDGRVQLQVPDGFSEKAPSKSDIKIQAVDSAGTTLMVISESQSEFASLREYGDIVRDQMLGQ